ncbi:hypothetical protein B0O99DRAFT_616400 [Bisporella sp. PMI_857]|nr:hypothetical protein B0O99DRAFT_616400 [Bisporella sp. PMI_857]
MPLAADSRYVESLWLLMVGDVLMNSRLKDLYEFGFIHQSYDPTLGDTDKPKRVDVEDSCYRVGLVHGGDYEKALDYPVIFHLLAQVVVITYDIASKDSIQKLERLYSQIPPPPDRRIHFREARPEVFTPMDYYPKILIGCRHPADSVREVEKEDIEKFMSDHPECTFAGECEPDDISIQTVNEVIQAAIEVYHGIRKKAQEVEPVPKVHLQLSKGI